MKMPLWLDMLCCFVFFLATEYHVGLVDSYLLFIEKAENGENLQKYMSQSNHPNSAGHNCVAAEILTWFF